MIDEEHTLVPIPTHLTEEIKKRIQDTEFKTVPDYITYVLTEVLTETEEEGKEAFSKEDEEKVKERLKALGYLG